MVTQKKLEKALHEQMQNMSPQKEQSIQKLFLGKINSLLHDRRLKNLLVDKLIFFYKFAFDPEYTYSSKTRLMLLGALLYFIMPLDLIADFIPGLGYLDDAMIIKMVWKSLQEEIENYKRYTELKQKSPA